LRHAHGGPEWRAFARWYAQLQGPAGRRHDRLEQDRKWGDVDRGNAGRPDPFLSVRQGWLLPHRRHWSRQDQYGNHGLWEGQRERRRVGRRRRLRLPGRADDKCHAVLERFCRQDIQQRCERRTDWGEYHDALTDRRIDGWTDRRLSAYPPIRLSAYPPIRETPLPPSP